MGEKRKTPRTAALYREVIQCGHRTVRVATYPPKEGQTTGVTFGIGYADPDTFAKIFFEVTPENWKQIQAAVKKALAAVPQEEQTDVPDPNDVKALTGRRRRIA